MKFKRKEKSGMGLDPKKEREMQQKEEKKRNLKMEGRESQEKGGSGEGRLGVEYSLRVTVHTISTDMVRSRLTARWSTDIRPIYCIRHCFYFKFHVCILYSFPRPTSSVPEREREREYISSCLFLLYVLGPPANVSSYSSCASSSCAICASALP